MMSDRVTAIIPTYNRRRTISSAIDSVLNQDFPRVELIVVDDGSTDDTRDVLAAYESRLRYVRQENGGPAAARNHGARLATGEWIAFLDSDDAWQPTKLTKQIDFTRACTADVCFHDFTARRCDTDERVPSWNTWLSATHSTRTLESGALPDPAKLITSGYDYFFTSTLLIRSEVFNELGGFAVDLPPCEDIDLYLRAARRYRFAFLAEQLAHREWKDNWDAEKTYQTRIMALRRALSDGVSHGDRAWADKLRRGLSREIRCLAGYYRSKGRPLFAARSYLHAALTKYKLA